VNNYITVEASISSNAGSSDNYQVKSFDLTQVKRLVTNDIVDPNVDAADGNLINVQVPYLTVTTLAEPLANSVVVGTSQYEFARFDLNAQGSGEDVKVKKIIVTDSINASASYSDIANLQMYLNGQPLATIASTATNAGTVTFTFQNPILVTRSTPITLSLKADVVSGTSGSHTFNIASDSDIDAVGATTGNTLSGSSQLSVSGSGQAMAIVSSGELIVSLISGSGASPSVDQVVNVGTTDMPVLAFKLTSQYENQKITSLEITATGTNLATTTLKNISLYQDSASSPFLSKQQFDSCNGGTCTVTFTDTNNILSQAVPSSGTTIYVKADVAGGGVSILGNDFVFSVASTSDIVAKGESTNGSATVVGTAVASGKSYVVPQNVVVEAVSPTTATQVGLGAGQTVAVFKISNNGPADIYLSSSTLQFTNGGSATSSLSFKIYASAIGGSQNDTSGWNSGSGYTTSSTGASSTIDFSGIALTSDEARISGNSFRYLTIRTTGAAANNDTFQLSVSSLGNILFDVNESQIGYDGNGDGDMSDTISGLYVDGTPSLATVTAKQ